jgi:hypothetical protein
MAQRSSTIGLSAFVVLLSLACGSDEVFRPMQVGVEGLSSQAEQLVLMVFPGSDNIRCGSVSLATVGGLPSPEIEARWLRSSGAPRRFDLGSVDQDRLSLVVYSEDSDGRIVQFGCREVDYSELEVPEIQIRLSRRIVRRSVEWKGNRLVHSGLSVCSDAGVWPRHFSLAGLPTPSCSS